MMSKNKKNKNQLTKGQAKKLRLEQQKKRKRKEWLISLIITLVILGIVVALQLWYAKVTHLGVKPAIVIPMHAIGGVLMLFIVHHFVKKPDDDEF